MSPLSLLRTFTIFIYFLCISNYLMNYCMIANVKYLFHNSNITILSVLDFIDCLLTWFEILLGLSLITYYVSLEGEI